MAASIAFFLLPAQAIAGTRAQNPLPISHLSKTAAVSIPQQDRETSENLKARTTDEYCNPTALGSPERRAGIAETCTAIASTQSQASPSTNTSRPAAIQAATEVCTITDPGYWNFERFSVCLREMTVEFTLRGQQQQVLGTAILYVSSSATLNPRSGSWSEEIVVEATQFTGDVKSLNVAANVTCTSNCKPTIDRPWMGGRTLTDGQVASGTVSYSNIPAVGVADSSTVEYHLYITQSGTIPTLPNVDWSNPRPVRCDSALTQSNSISTGCALPHITPKLELPVSTYGSAAITYGWAQWNLPNKWGLYSGSPLTRALDGNDRREFTCEGKSSVPFVKRPDIVPEDSCDEFPFASSEQGGNDGGKCAEIFPLFEDGEWKIYTADPARPITYTEPCVRGHVPLPLNRLAGTAYSNLIQNQRLIEKDPFYVSVPDYFDVT